MLHFSEVLQQYYSVYFRGTAGRYVWDCVLVTVGVCHEWTLASDWLLVVVCWLFCHVDYDIDSVCLLK